MEVLFRPSIHDNLEHWQVFKDDDQIIRFMENSKEFTDSQINFMVDSMDLEVVNLRNNTLPKGCIPLGFLGHPSLVTKPSQCPFTSILEEKERR
jgi:hypothetical protein